MRTYTVEWEQRSDGAGQLCLIKAGGELDYIPWAEPITAASDSWAIAADVCYVLGLDLDKCDVEHEGEYIHITVLE